MLGSRKVDKVLSRAFGEKKAFFLSFVRRNSSIYSKRSMKNRNILDEKVADGKCPFYVMRGSLIII